MTMLQYNLSGTEEQKMPDYKINIFTINNNIIIEPQIALEKNIDIAITDLLGKQIYTETIEPQADLGRYELKTDLPTGVYVCRAITGNKAYSQKIEIVR